MKKGIKYKGRYNLPKCLDCGKQLSRKDAKYCRKCCNKSERSGMYGKHHSEETKRIIGIKHSGKNNYFYGKKRPEHSIAMSGSNNPRWLGGYSRLPYNFIFNKKFKEKIRKKYNYICGLCYKFGKDVHHIDYNKNNNYEENFIVLCHKCNCIVNFNRDYWKDYFIMKLNKLKGG